MLLFRQLLYPYLAVHRTRAYAFGKCNSLKEGVVQLCAFSV